MALFGFLIVISGCEWGGQRLTRVRGQVTFKGRPVPNLFINFVPDKGRPSWALTDADGRFTAHYDKDRNGAIPGKHKVFMTFKRFDPRDGGTRLTEPANLMPILAKYGQLEKSPLRIVVNSGEQVVDLRLD